MIPTSGAIRTALAKALPAITIAPPSRDELSDATEAHGLTGHADALRSHGADVVVKDLAELLDHS